ncbi:hypothetical protein GCM10009716_17650 [Streptomyces sodiiphilus]|uniref:Uncharacterized protein n=1 Tax=Streptomyces sodiiphilus TaxID=226217 RepID=A0ABN2P0X7_9ACTN
MNEVVAHINESPVLADVEIRDTKGTVIPGSSPVLATPAAFLGGVAIASATVAAFEAGRNG